MKAEKDVALIHGNTVEYGNSQAVPRAHWRLYLAAISVNICTINVGCSMAWTSSAERFLVDEGVYPGPLDSSTWSLVTSAPMLGALISPIPFGFVMDRFGRKPCFGAIGVMSVISWALIAAANGATMILISRLLGGIVGACQFIVLALYIAEISTDNVRSTLGALMMLSLTFGYLLSFSVGPYVLPVGLAIVSGAVSVVFLAIFATGVIPESPYVLVEKGNLEGATRSLALLRGNPSAGVAAELEIIKAAIRQANVEKAPVSQTLRSLFCSRGNLKGFIISCALLMFMQLCGNTPVLFYSERIFRSTGSSLDPAVCTIIIGAVQFVASGATIFLTRFFSIKMLLILSAAGMAIAHGTLGYYFYLKDGNGDFESLGTLPIFALIFFMAFNCFGFGSLPWAVVGEMHANDVKAIASTLATTLSCSVSFLLIWQFTNLLGVLGSAWTFWTFAIICATACVFTTLVVPNTRGKSLQEIHDGLSGLSQ